MSLQLTRDSKSCILPGRIDIPVISPHIHTTHPQVRNRLKRADGHLHNVVAMIDEGKPCLKIVQQLHAVEKAISAAKKALIHDHLDHCLEDAVRAQPRGSRTAVAEFKDITKYL